jgi:glycosyltransferase involved in cell wall biosynthesis
MTTEAVNMMKRDLVSVVIPAHDEEAVIQRTLRTLLRRADPGEFEVIVVCNGCSDATAEIAAREIDDVVVIERDEASKTSALNAGLQAARGRVVILLDADVELETQSARAMVDALSCQGVEVAIGHMEVDTRGADPIVRAFYRVWMHHPYLRRGKFAAAIALSRDGIARIGSIPPVTADDTYLRRLFPKDRVAAVESVRYKVRAPRTARSLLRVRSRSYRGTRELSGHTESTVEYRGEAQGLLRQLLGKPALWLYVPVYVAVVLAARGLSYRNAGGRWERDLTTRTAVPE